MRRWIRSPRSRRPAHADLGALESMEGGARGFGWRGVDGGRHAGEVADGPGGEVGIVGIFFKKK